MLHQATAMQHKFYTKTFYAKRKILRKQIKKCIEFDLFEINLGFPFAKFVCNFCKRERNSWFCCASFLREKIQLCAIQSTCAILLLRYSVLCNFTEQILSKRLNKDVNCMN